MNHFWSKVDKKGDEACWLWTGAKTSRGYGHLKWQGQFIQAHRLSYTTLVGPVPKGLELHHTCGVKHCVNPSHLNTVTHRENSRRSFSLNYLSHCARGHLLTADNIGHNESNGQNYCRRCFKGER